MKSFALIAALFIAAPAAFASTQLVTLGEAKLPRTIQIENEGVVTSYSTDSIRSPKFNLYNDTNFGIGSQTRCDPYLGRTVEELKIELNITSREERNYSASTKVELAPKGKAVLTIPAGTIAFGRCQSESTNLEALGLQLANSDGTKNRDGKFSLEPVSE